VDFKQGCGSVLDPDSMMLSIRDRNPILRSGSRGKKMKKKCTYICTFAIFKTLIYKIPVVNIVVFFTLNFYFKLLEHKFFF
jgi:hypothetical protein